MPDLKRTLQQSDELDSAVWTLLPDASNPAVQSARHLGALSAALIAVEHARGFRLLIGNGLYTSGIALTRMQFEALVRGMWLLYAASEEDVRRATTTLTLETEREANSLPMATKMLEALQSRAPAGAFEMMSTFREAMLKALHSFVHSGLHPLQRHMAGYSETLLRQVVCNSNGLLVATGAFQTILAGRQDLMHAMSQLQLRFVDCLPDLVQATPAEP